MKFKEPETEEEDREFAKIYAKIQREMEEIEKICIPIDYPE